MIYFFVLLLRIVAYLDDEAKIISFLGVFAIISYSTLKRTSSRTFVKMSKTNFYITLLILTIVLHGFLFGKILLRDIAVLLTYWIWFVFTMAYFKNKTPNQALKYILISFLIYNIANYLFFELYFSNQKSGINMLMEIFGIHGYRIYFPLSSGANVFTFQVGTNAILTLYFLKIKSKKIIYVLIYCFYIFLLFLADSRLVLLFTLFFTVIYWFSFKTIMLFIKKYWALIITLMIISIYVFYSTAIFDGIKRHGEVTGQALSRIDIWSYAIGTIFDGYQFLSGHGLNGFEINQIDNLREAFENQNLQTAHNFFIQNIIDFGFIGLILILFLLYQILRMVVRINSQIITVLFIMFLLIGTTESIPTFYSFDATLFFISLLSIIITQNERKNIRFFKNSNVLPQKNT